MSIDLRNSFPAVTPLTEEEDKGEQQERGNRITTEFFHDFFNGKLINPHTTLEDLDGEAFLQFLMEYMYEADYSLRNAEYPAILKALEKRQIIMLKTETISIRYAEDYIVTFDKFSGYDYFDSDKGPKQLSDYFRQYYRQYKLPEREYKE